MITPKLQFYFLRDRQFDSVFILLPLLTAIISAMICVWQPEAFPLIIFLDVWLLAYHHVIASYTRIAFDWANVQAHRFLVLVLPFIVICAVFLFYQIFGLWIIFTVYFYWQWFHYTRQSYGISRYYLARKPSPSYSIIDSIALYSLPVAGILYRSWQSPETFLSVKLWVVPVSYEIVIISTFFSVIFIAIQLYKWRKSYLDGTLNGSYVIYMLNHYGIFYVGYFLIDDINFGWLALNIWHNMQYIIFVWLKNNKTYSSGIDPEHYLISKISQNGKVLQYMLVCIGITLCVYIPLLYLLEKIQELSTISVVLTLFIAMNFHHYIVDSLIWKRKV